MTVPDRLSVPFDPGGVPQVELQADLRQAQIIQNSRGLIEVV